MNLTMKLLLLAALILVIFACAYYALQQAG